MLFHIHHIYWDASSRARKKLPKSLKVTIHGASTPDEIVDAIEEFLAETYGYCVEYFEYTEEN